MEHIDRFRDSFPDVARDVKINLESVLTPGTLNTAQVWGTAIACACRCHTGASARKRARPVVVSV